ncbi:MAG: glycosyltransferase family 39 protein, partial [Anaerolineales bacterium]|nr:glycosyltransferase family 39 protein [Anaerolineales bacterium]
MISVRPRHFLSFIAILLLATALRFYLLDNQSFWNDEGNTARLSERSVRLIIEGTASDIHPPLYYLILRGWRELVGQSEFALRAFSALMGVLTVATTIRLGRWLDSTPNGRNSWAIAYVAGMLTAVSPALIYYSQEARMYSLLGFLATLSTLLLFKLQKNPRWPLVFGYTAALTAGLYTHYFFPAIIVSHFLIWFIGQLPTLAQQKRPLALLRHPLTIRYATANLLALLLYAPWLPIFLRSTGGGAGSTLDAAFTWRAATWLLTGPVVHTATVLVIGAVFLTSAVRRIRFRWPTGRFSLYIWVLIPLLMMNLAGSTEPQHLKFLTTAVPPLMLLIAMRTVGLWQLRAPGRENDRFLHHFGRVMGAALAGPALIGMGLLLNQLYHNPTYFRADYRAMAAQIEAAHHPDAGIILNAPNQWEVFTYYYDGSADVYPFPKVNSTAAEITPQLEEIAAAHERLYLILWGEQGFDPERQVESWLDAHAFKAQDEWRGDVRFVSYAIPTAAATE